MKFSLSLLFKILLVIYILLIFVDAILAGAISLFLNLNYFFWFLVLIFVLDKINVKFFQEG